MNFGEATTSNNHFEVVEDEVVDLAPSQKLLVELPNLIFTPSDRVLPEEFQDQMLHSITQKNCFFEEENSFHNANVEHKPDTTCSRVTEQTDSTKKPVLFPEMCLPNENTSK